jgi:branched-chain amino acid transport system ATP-binding protein
MAVLELAKVNARYGDSHILHDVSFTVQDGEVVCLLGRNGAGKTTTLLTIMGYLAPRPGSIVFRGQAIGRLPPHRIARLGLGFVPQERHIFPSLTVQENLTVAARAAGRSGRWDLPFVFALFPRLAERRQNLGWQLSGGEQQMLAIARALMLNPALLLLDEPSEGLAPLVVREIVQVIEGLKREGLAVLLVEQNLAVALRLADRHHILSKGRIAFSGSSAELEKNEQVKKAHLTV